MNLHERKMRSVHKDGFHFKKTKSKESPAVAGMRKLHSVTSFNK